MAKDWLPSYLNNRKQFVSTNGYNWSFEKVIFGVPQEFISSPLLFPIHVKDLYLAIKCSRVRNFVADTNLLNFKKWIQAINKQANYGFIGPTCRLNTNKTCLDISQN